MTLRKPDIELPVEAQGTLRLDTPDGQVLALVADGDVLRVALPGWIGAQGLAPRSFRERRRLVRAAARALSTCGLTLSLEAADRPIARLGSGAKTNWLARLLGIAPAHIPVSAIRFYWSRSRARSAPRSEKS